MIDVPRRRCAARTQERPRGRARDRATGLVAAVSPIRRSRRQLFSAAQGSGALVATLATADRLLWLEEHAAADAAGAGTLPAPDRLAQGVRLRGLRFTYPGTDTDVLDGLDLDLPAGATVAGATVAGATVAVVGENGPGKTTLIKLLLGMYRPAAGQILVDGTPLAEIDPRRWRGRCTAAFQDFSRLHLAAVESVGAGELPGLADEAAACDALERAGAGELPGQLPDGLATLVGSAYTGGHELSGGQWQKLALGRAMRRGGRHRRRHRGDHCAGVPPALHRPDGRPDCLLRPGAGGRGRQPRPADGGGRAVCGIVRPAGPGI